MVWVSNWRCNVLIYSILFLFLNIISFSRDLPKYADSSFYGGATGYATIPDNNYTDLNYSGSFSVECILKIEPHTTNDRWAPILVKGDSRLLYSGSYDGFGISTSAGDYPYFGQQIVASVSDGTTLISKTTSSYYEGMIYIVFTYDYNNEKLILYINGSTIGNSSNSSIVSENIENASAFFLGGNSTSKSKKDIFLTRIWNRLLSSEEILTLYENWNNTGQTNTPSGFNNTNITSEWLMQQTCNSSGSEGSTHILDTSINGNHLELISGAEIQTGSGSLSISSPESESTNINKSVHLIASGGRETIGDGVVLPLHYQFLIDESSDFDSSNLKDSGWIKNYRCWKPRLKPETEYYWKCRVKDSKDSPTISEYTSVVSFTTESSTNWYVRNGVYSGNNRDNLIPETGVYGEQNGTSYENAWNGLTSIVWGESGVEPGDNLYICGDHIYEHNSPGDYKIGIRYIEESGYSVDYPITIRMDYEEDPGRLFGLCKSENLWETEWNGPDENGVYWTDDIQYSVKAEIYEGEYVWFYDQTSTTWEGDYNHIYQTYQVASPWKTDKIYVKTSDGSSPEGKMYGDIVGYDFNLGRSKFIKFYKCDFYDINILSDSSTVTDTIKANNIIYDTCDIHDNSTINLYQENNNWIIRNCTIHDNPNGIYTHTPGNMYDGLIENNQIYDCGTEKFPHDDEHGIGIQNGVGFIIQNNHIWNTGEAICFWSGTYDMKNNIVRYNYIHDTHIGGITGGHGISFSNNVAPGKRTGNKIYGNVLNNIGIDVNDDWQGKGLSLVISDYIEVYNNTICNTNDTRGSIYLDSGNYALKAEVYNNIIYSPNSKFIYLYGSDNDNWDVTINNNLFYEVNDSLNQFYSSKNSGYLNYTNWKSSGYDAQSVSGNPLFTSTLFTEIGHFNLQEESPAINAGAPVNLSQDIAGTSTPLGLYDIGAFEFVGGEENIHPIISNISYESTSNPAVYTLSVTASDEDESPSPLSYKWTKLSGKGEVSFSDSTSSETTVTVRSNGEFVFNVRVSDGLSISEETITINVLNRRRGSSILLASLIGN